MAEFAELALEGVPVATEHFEKVYDPLKDKTKQGIQKAKRMRENNRTRDYSESEYDSYEDDRPPRRSYTDRGARSSRSRGRDGDIIEERRVVKTTTNGRARSVGRDGYSGARGSGHRGEPDTRYQRHDLV